MTPRTGPARYTIALLTADRRGDCDSLASELKQQVDAATRGQVALDFVTAPAGVPIAGAGPSVDAVVVLSGGKATADDVDISAAAERARDAMLPVLPVVHSLKDFRQQAPEVLHPLNGLQLASADDVPRVALHVLRLVGLTEAHRQIFISYLRDETTDLAEQLRRELIDIGWDVFLDRFSVPPAADFQARLDRELADRSFVVLLESPSISSSPWVEHEIAFAIRHTLGILSLSMPGMPTSSKHPALDDAWRLNLSGTDVTTTAPPTLSAAGLAKVIGEIESRHSYAMRLRRERTILDAADELRSAGFTITPVGHAQLLADRGSTRHILYVTARAARVEDLRRVSDLRLEHRSRGVRTHGWVVHPSEDPDIERVQLLSWLTKHRMISTTPLMLLAGRVRP